MHKNKTDKSTDKTNEADLIKIRTIKAKHVEQLLEPLDTTPRQKIEGSFYDGVEFLAYIKAYDAILARRLDNQHLSVIWLPREQSAQSRARQIALIFLLTIN